MSIKLNSFASYTSEAFGMYLKNIHTIFGITFLINIAILYAPATLGTYILSILRPDYYTENGLTISISSANDIIFCATTTLIIFLIFIAYDAILSVYAFYITFKSDEEDYHLFIAMIKDHLWNIIKAKFIAFTYIAIGFICLVIPGIMLTLRYSALNYFVMVEGAKFPQASVKSSEVMNGFKLIFFIISIAFIAINRYSVSYIQPFIDQVVAQPILHAISSIALETIFATLNVVSSIITYSLCKHEANQTAPIEPVVVMTEAPLEVAPIEPTISAPEVVVPISEPPSQLQNQ